MKKFAILVFAFTLVMLYFSSCKEPGVETDFNPNVKSSKDLVFAEDLMFEIINVMFSGVTDTGVMDQHYNYVLSCGISYSEITDSLRFSYGDVNRLCYDNKFRRGALNGILDGQVFAPGASVTLVADSLFVDDDLIEGAIRCEFLGPTTDGQQQFTFVIDSAWVTLHDTTLEQNVIRFSCNYVLTWEQGANTPYLHDDDLLLASGNMSGKSREGYDFQSTVTDPLVDDINCFWVVSGTHQLNTPSAEITSGTIDYITEDFCNFEVNFYFGESFFYDDITH